MLLANWGAERVNGLRRIIWRPIKWLSGNSGIAIWPRGELNSTVRFGREFRHCVQKVLINAIGLFIVGAMTCIRNDG